MSEVLLKLLLIGIAGAALMFGGVQEEQYARAKQLLNEGRAAEAAALYRELARADSDNANLQLNTAIALYQAKDYRGAVESAQTALQLKPDLLPASLFEGASFLELGNFPEAVRALTRVVAADPGERNGQLMLGRALLADGKPKFAVEHFRIAAELLPSNPAAWYGLGKSLDTSGDKQAAGEAWQRLGALPTSFESHLHAAEIQDYDERWREASTQWRQALQLAPENQMARLGLARALFRSRDYPAVEAVLKPLLPNASAEVSFLYGASLMNRQEVAEAIPYLREARQQNRSFLPATAALGQALMQTGKPLDAVPLLEEAKSADSDGSVHFQLFRAYQLSGKTSEALQAKAEYQRFLDELSH